MLMLAYCSALCVDRASPRAHRIEHDDDVAEAKKPHAFVKLSDGGAKARLAASKARNIAQKRVAACMRSAATATLCVGDGGR